MKGHRGRSLLVLCLAVILSLPLPPTLAAADSGDSGWLARALVGWNGVPAPNELLLDGGATCVRFGPADEIAYGVEIERRLTRRLGVELGMLYSRLRVERRSDSAEVQEALLFEEATFRPITAGLDIHLTPERRVDLTLTPLAGYAFSDDLIGDGGGTTLPVDDDFVWGVRAAADIPLGESGWGVSLAARYLETSMRTEFEDGPVAIALDPVVLTAGLSFRWPRTSPSNGYPQSRWPFYRLNGKSVPFRPRDDLVAVAFTRAPPDSRSTAELVATLFEELHLEPLEPETEGEEHSFSAAGGSILLFRITRPIEQERLRESIARLLGPEVRVGIVVDEPDRVKVLDNRFVVRFRGDLPPREIEVLVGRAGGRILRSFIQAPNTHLVEFLRGDYREHLQIVETWHQRGLLVYGEPDLLVEIVEPASPADPANSEDQLNLTLQNVTMAWQHLDDIEEDLVLGSPKVHVATLDRGVQMDHPDIGGDLTDGTPQLAQCFDFKQLIPCTDTAYRPDNDHGMQVYGIISARADNGIGIDGIAPNVHHIAMKRQALYNSEYLDALLWAAGFQVDRPPAGWPAQPSSPGADIISLSHYTYFPSPPGLMDDTFRYLTTYGRGGRGTLLIYAAGNLETSIAQNNPFPAHPHTMAISNSDAPDAEGVERLNSTSNFGFQIDLCAQGAGVLSLNASGGVLAFGDQATSAAAPMVAAAAALMLSAEPSLTWIDLRDILRETAARIDPDGGGWTADGTSELYGFGRLDVGAAVETAASDR